MEVKITREYLSGLSHSQKDDLILVLHEQNQLLTERVSQQSKEIAQQSKAMAQQSNIIALQTKQISLLESKVKSLEDRINTNSSNSGKPPSSDGFNKPEPKSRRGKSKKTRGGQHGHRGTTLRRVNNPNSIEKHNVDTCNNCNEDLKSVSGTTTATRQVFDIPKLELQVVEHQIEEKKCPHCCCITKSEFPSEVTSPVQYGSQVKSLMVYLSQYQLLPYKRLAEFFKDVFNQGLSQGTLVNVNLEAYTKLELIESSIKESLEQSTILHADETGLKVINKLHWLHVYCTDKHTYYAIHPKRGPIAMEEIGLLPKFNGKLIHEHFRPYFKYGRSHGLCNAHILRELTFLQERDNCKWAESMEKLLLKIKNKIEEHMITTNIRLSNKEIKKYYGAYTNILSNGRQECPVAKPITGKKRRVKQTKAYNLVERMRKYRLEVLAFMYDSTVPFDNNQAERDIRMMKVHQKISGCFQSINGAKMFCRIRGCISTTRKQGHNVLNSIEKAMLNQPITL